jgi:hypothetical protein
MDLFLLQHLILKDATSVQDVSMQLKNAGMNSLLILKLRLVTLLPAGE